MTYFKVNEYITLRLEKAGTKIYVKGKFFNLCKRLVLNIPVRQIEDYDQINSIDEAAEIYERNLYDTHNNFKNETYDINRTQKINRQQEFWGHCSNMQTWVEHNYDTRILHSNLSFPLLKQLVEVGDNKAKKVLSEEIAKRYLCLDERFCKKLIKMDLFDYLSEQEILSCIEEIPEEKAFLKFPLIKELFSRKGINSSKILLSKEIVKYYLCLDEKICEELISMRLLSYLSEQEILSSIEEVPEEKDYFRVPLMLELFNINGRKYFKIYGDYVDNLLGNKIEMTGYNNVRFRTNLTKKVEKVDLITFIHLILLANDISSELEPHLLDRYISFLNYKDIEALFKIIVPLTKIEYIYKFSEKILIKKGNKVDVVESYYKMRKLLSEKDIITIYYEIKQIDNLITNLFIYMKKLGLDIKVENLPS